MFDRIPQWRHLVQTSVCKEFLNHIFYFSSSDQMFELPVSSWLNFGRLYVSRNLSISFRFCIFGVCNCSYFLMIFCVLEYWLLFLLSHFLFCLFGSFLSFLMSLAESLSVSLSFPKASFCFHWSLLFCGLYFICFSLIFIISFLMLTLGFVFSFFLVPLGSRLGVYLRFFLFLEEGLYHDKIFLLEMFCI